MEELIKIEKSPITGNPIVNARDLYKFLDIGEKFSDWIKDKIERWEFIENQDYTRIYYDVFGKRLIVSHNIKEDMKESGFANQVYRIEYALTLDTAKEIAMVQNNAAGRKLRQYFIDVEKKWKKSQSEPQTKIQIINAGSRSIADTARLFNSNSHQLNMLLRKNKYFKPNNQPYQKWVNQGLFLIEQYNPKYYSAKRIKVTENKGLPVIQQLFGQNNFLSPVVVENCVQLLENEYIIKLQLIEEKCASQLQLVNRLNNLEDTMVTFINYMLACRTRKPSPVEIEGYRSLFKEFKLKTEKERAVKAIPVSIT